MFPACCTQGVPATDHCHACEPSQFLGDFALVPWLSLDLEDFGVAGGAQFGVKHEVAAKVIAEPFEGRFGKVSPLCVDCIDCVSEGAVEKQCHSIKENLMTSVPIDGTTQCHTTHDQC